jgi:uncharacterized cupredoxin-like copper-binding protein
MVAVIVALAIAIASGSALAGTRQYAQTQRVAKAQLIAKVNVTASEFKFVLSAKSAKRGIVIFKVKNVGKLAHDFSISGRKTRLLSHGQSATLRVTFLRKGAYPYKCTVAGHAAAGMKGVFTIT